MLKNYLTIALRTLWKQKLYTAVNTTGLALGITCCILVALFVRDELSFDRFFPNADRIVFIGLEDASFGGLQKGMSTAYPLAEAIQRDIPGVVHASRMAYVSPGRVTLPDGTSYEERVLPADSAFFDVFGVPFVLGNPETALLEPNTTVISESLARKYFGDENPIGKTLTVEGYDRIEARITGVMANLAGSGHMQFDLVYSLSSLGSTASNVSTWNAMMYQTFALLDEKADRRAFARSLADLAPRYQGAETTRKYFPVPLTQLYLSDLTTNSGFKGSARYVYLFTGIALFILLIACINYMNLATAKSTRRAREVGVRKTLGADRFQLARQFLGESILMTIAAFAAAMVLVQVALPAFNYLFEKELTLSLASDGIFIFVLFALALGIGVAAGSYPALYLSRFQPAETLKDGARLRASSATVRRGFVVVQFAISVFLIASTVVIYRQLQYVKEKDLGFEAEHVLSVSIPWKMELRRNWSAMKEAFLRHPNVVTVSAADTRPGGFGATMIIPPDPSRPDLRLAFKAAKVDHDYDDVLGLEVVAGRFLSEEFTSDLDEGIILNETAAREMGWSPDEAVGKPFRWNGSGVVVGVVRDFHAKSLHEAITPVALRLREPMEPLMDRAYGMIVLRLSGGDISGTMTFLEREWRKLAPDEPFSFEFLDEAFDALYRTEQRLAHVLTSFAAVAILISCMGLFAMFTFASEQRTKEIGIRKVFGASVAQVVGLLSTDFSRLIVIALLVALPIAYVVMSRWLESFAYHVDLSAGMFIGSALLSFGIAVATVSYQAVKAAVADPIKSLRYE